MLTYKVISKHEVGKRVVAMTDMVVGWLMSSQRCLPSSPQNQDFPGSPVVKTSLSSEGSSGWIPNRGAKIPHASQGKKPKHRTEIIL